MSTQMLDKDVTDCYEEFSTKLLTFTKRLENAYHQMEYAEWFEVVLEELKTFPELNEGSLAEVFRSIGLDMPEEVARLAFI